MKGGSIMNKKVNSVIYLKWRTLEEKPSALGSLVHKNITFFEKG